MGNSSRCFEKALLRCLTQPLHAGTRREEEERQRLREAERRAQEAEEERRAAEARAAKEAERQALARLATRFAMRLEGAATIAKPPPVRRRLP